MKSIKLYLPFCIFLLGILFLLTYGCNKNDSSGTIPVITTADVSNIVATMANSGGIVTSDGGASVTARGVCWSAAPSPTIADKKTVDALETGSYSSHLWGLTPNTTYNVRAYATNNAGTAYGANLSFSTISASVIIGTQEWMVENLNVTKYRNGDPIPNVTDAAQWSGLTTGGYADYDNSPSDALKFGHLYNWYAIADNRNICPVGWHIPSDAEWVTLVDFLGGQSVAGGKLKESGTTNWSIPNTGATNESGFTALPGGHHDFDATFTEINTGSGFWVSGEYSTTDGIISAVLHNTAEYFKFNVSKKDGVSIRCIKD